MLSTDQAIEIASACDVTYFAEQRLHVELDDWQADLLRALSLPRARVCIVASRQSGKSMCSGIACLHEAIYRPRTTSVILAPTERQAAENLRSVADFYSRLSMPKPARQTETTLELQNGSRVLSLPGGNVGGIRGFRVSLAAIDEAAYCPDDLYVAAAPMLAVSGGRMLLASTPCGSTGFFFTAAHDPAWRRIDVTADRIKRIDPAFLREQERTMPRARFDAEYMCCFSDAEAQVFPTEIIESLDSDDEGIVIP